MGTTIYYFTGTGNSLKIAKDLSDNIEDCRIIRICNRNMKAAETDSEKIGFVFPVYFRGLPKMAESFIEKLDVRAGRYFFAVANFGSYAALTFEQIHGILKRKGKVLSANFGIAMPGNMWFMYYPHPKEDYTDRMNAEPLLAKDIAMKINDGFVNGTAAVPDREKEEKMYEAFKPERIDENFWTGQSCDGCGICSKVCPAENIELVEKKPSWKHHCEQCLACLHLCPKGAVEFKQDSIGKERFKNVSIQLAELVYK